MGSEMIDDGINRPDPISLEPMTPHGGRRKGAGRPPELEDRVRVTVDIESADLDRLRALADKDGVSVNSLFRDAVKALLRRRRKR